MRFESIKTLKDAVQEEDIAPDIATSLIDSIRPAIGFSRLLVEDDTIEPGICKVGGRPDLHPDTKWPSRGDTRWPLEDKLDRPLIFLAQMNLGELSKRHQGHMNGVLPEVGVLSFFVDTWPDSPDLPDGGVNIKLSYYQGPREDLVRRDIPVEISQAYDDRILSSEDPTPFPYSAITTAEALIPVPLFTLEDPLYRAEADDLRQILERLADKETSIKISADKRLVEGSPCSSKWMGSDQIAGWPSPIERSFRMDLNIGLKTLPPLEEEQDDTPVHTFTIQGSSENPGTKTLWPGGNIYVYIRRYDLDARINAGFFAFAQFE